MWELKMYYYMQYCNHASLREVEASIYRVSRRGNLRAIIQSVSHQKYFPIISALLLRQVSFQNFTTYYSYS